MNKRAYIIDGRDFSNLKGFWDEVSDKIIPNVYWGRNLDAFNDILHGGFGTPAEGFVLIWKNSGISRNKLGYDETINWCKNKILHCHPTNIDYFEKRIDELKRREGKTLFDEIIEIISLDEHSNIQLKLE